MTQEHKTKILLVDDNVNLCVTLSFILTQLGYAVTIAEDGIEALDCVQETTFDFVFMDIKMPHMNGVDTYRQIKKFNLEATVILMTAYAVEDLIQEALNEGAFSVIYKPFEIDEILKIISSK